MRIGRISGIMAISGLSATAAYSQISTNPSLPTTVPASGDKWGNFALGSSALANVEATIIGAGETAPCSYPTSWNSCNNLAIGAQALATNTIGYENLGIGSYALYANTTGQYNTAIGAYALFANQTGRGNTAVGTGDLSFSTGNANTGIGSYALWRNTTGNNNTALGYYALLRYQTPGNNTAIGANSMIGQFTQSSPTAQKDFSINTGANNTAVGAATLTVNTAGGANSVLGTNAMTANVTGSYNSAFGIETLAANTVGNYNAAFGAAALQNSVTASQNTAIGTGALRSDTTGRGNSATGFLSLYGTTTGIGNTAVGSSAGVNVATGNYNTYIGYGVAGFTSADQYVTRIGVTTIDPSNPGSPTTFVGGIYNSGVTGGLPVYVTASGQLGFSASSERYKTDIRTLQKAGDRLKGLRAVSFHVRSDPRGALQYGLIAEEVDRVYPELVIRDASGTIQGVRYDELAPLLLGEVQQQAVVIAELQAQNADMQRQLAKVDELERRLDAALGATAHDSGRVAQR